MNAKWLQDLHILIGNFWRAGKQALEMSIVSVIFSFWHNGKYKLFYLILLVGNMGITLNAFVLYIPLKNCTGLIF